MLTRGGQTTSTNLPSVSTPAPPQVAVSVEEETARVNAALTRIRARHGARAGLDLDKSNTNQQTVLEAPMARGRLLGLYLFGKDGLKTVPRPERADSNFREFVLENADLFGIEEHASSPKGLFWVTKIDDTTTLQPNGAKLQTLTYRQSIGSIPIADGDFKVAIWNDKFASVSGTIYNPTRGLAALTPRISADQATAIAQTAKETSGMSTGAASSELEIWAGTRRLVYRVRQSSDPSAQPATRASVLVDAESGEIFHVDKDRADIVFPVSAPFTVYQPSPFDFFPSTPVQVNLTGNGIYDMSRARYYAYQLLASDRSPVIGYTQVGGLCSRFFFPYSQASFTYTGSNEPKVRAQHINYWTELAVNTSNINFQWWPPPSSTRYWPVTVVSDSVETGYGGIKWYGCDCVANSTPCIVIANSGLTTFPKNAPYLSVMFHEVGHAIDWKYTGGVTRHFNDTGTCVPGSEEGLSLAEGIAGLYSIMMHFQEFPAAWFTTYGTTPNSTGDPSIYAGVENYPVHLDSGSIECYRQPGVACGLHCYQYSHPLVQAYFEVARGVNCGSNPCYVMNDSVGLDQARWALFYAMSQTGLGQGYQEFVYKLLEYYYYDVGYTQWNNRWWVFNHHSLIGPKYGYSPCHAF
jgi:hypothetical protein